MVKFVFGDPTISSSLTYEFMTYVRSADPTDYDLISTSFPPQPAAEGSYTFCVNGHSLAREPTPAPTVSSVPTSVPVPPSRTPTAGPTVPPTPRPHPGAEPAALVRADAAAVARAVDDAGALPTPVPSAACPAPTADWIRVSTRDWPRRRTGAA